MEDWLKNIGDIFLGAFGRGPKAKEASSQNTSTATTPANSSEIVSTYEGNPVDVYDTWANENGYGGTTLAQAMEGDDEELTQKFRTESPFASNWEGIDFNDENTYGQYGGNYFDNLNKYGTSNFNYDNLQGSYNLLTGGDPLLDQYYRNYLQNDAGLSEAQLRRINYTMDPTSDYVTEVNNVFANTDKSLWDSRIDTYDQILQNEGGKNSLAKRTFASNLKNDKNKSIRNLRSNKIFNDYIHSLGGSFDDYQYLLDPSFATNTEGNVALPASNYSDLTANTSVDLNNLTGSDDQLWEILRQVYSKNLKDMPIEKYNQYVATPTTESNNQSSENQNDNIVVNMKDPTK